MFKPPAPFPEWLDIQIEGAKISFLIKSANIPAIYLFTPKDFTQLQKYIDAFQPYSLIFMYVKLDVQKSAKNLEKLLANKFIDVLDFGGPTDSFFSGILDQNGIDWIAKALISNQNISGLRLSYQYSLEKNNPKVKTDEIIAMVKENRTLQFLSIKFRDQTQVLRAVLQYNSTIEELSLIDLPEILKNSNVVQKFDFAELAEELGVPLIKNSSLRKIHFPQKKIFEHVSGVKIYQEINSPSPPKSQFIGTPPLFD